MLTISERHGLPCNLTNMTFKVTSKMVNIHQSQIFICGFENSKKNTKFFIIQTKSVSSHVGVTSARTTFKCETELCAGDGFKFTTPNSDLVHFPNPPHFGD